MDQTPPSLWKRPWRGPARILAWFALLAGASFVTFCGIGLLAHANADPRDLMLFALLGSVVVLAVASAGFLFIPWISSWRNFRRVLFVAVCLITLLALAWVEENWRGKHAWRKHRGEWQAKGEKFDIAALAPPSAPDEKNFALTPLLRPALDFTRGPAGLIWRDTNGLERSQRISAEDPPKRGTNDHLVLGSLEKGTFADIAACGEFYRGNTNYPQAAPSAPPAEEILAALGKFAPELKELREAAASRPDSRFPIQYDYEPSWAILLPHLAPMKRVTVLTHVRATAELEAARSAEAFDDLKLGLRFSDSIRGEPILIDHLVRLATLGIDLQTVREGLARHAWNEAQLAELETYLASVDLLAEYKLAMRGERALTTEGLNYLRRQGFRGDPMDYLGDEEGRSASAPPLNLMPSGWFYQNMLTISRMFQEFILPAVDERARRVSPEVSENGGRARAELRWGPYTSFAKLLLPALERPVRKSARTQTYVDSTRVACAVERFRLANGRLPDTLAVLTPALIDAIPKDVIDGQPLRYRRNPDGGFLLYSVGWNQKDDGGQIAWTTQKKGASVDATQGDWVWQMSGQSEGKLP